jgi:hypothetical protein
MLRPSIIVALVFFGLTAWALNAPVIFDTDPVRVASVDAGVSSNTSIGAPDDTVIMVFKDVEALRAAAKAGDKAATYLAISALVAFGLKWIITFLQSLKVDDLTDKAKRAIPWICAALGVGVGVTSKFAMGTTWTNAIILGGGPPGAVLFHELVEAAKGFLFKKKADISPALSKPPTLPPAA